MAKRQKHYLTQKEIDKDIQKSIRKMEKCRLEAAEEDARADYLVKQNNPNDAEQIVWFREKAKELRDKAGRIENVRLLKLKRLSAAFNTAMLPGMSEDKSVVLENL